MKIIIYHGFYGCDTGCCGHWIELDGHQRFVFDSPRSKEKALDWARNLIEKEFGKEHIADLDWENCEIDTECKYC